MKGGERYRVVFRNKRDGLGCGHKHRSIEAARACLRRTFLSGYWRQLVVIRIKER